MSINILVVSYGILGHDGRLNEIIKSANLIGNVETIAFSLEETKNKNILKINKSDERASFWMYFKFISHIINSRKQLSKIDILIADDFMTSLAVLICSFILKPTAIVQDSREFYYRKKMPGLGKIFVFFEQCLYKKADLISCANKQRAQLMSILYKITTPLVFENIRELKSETINHIELDEKYKTLKLTNKYKIISTGGCSIERGTLDLVLTMRNLPNCVLYIIGKGEKKDYEKLLALINKEKIYNVNILDRVSLEELVFLVKKCDIGIVEYHKKDLNNLYCASGKIYEYMSCGLPIVTTENIPLIDLCAAHKVGIANDNREEAIKEIIENIDFYQKNVSNYMKSISAEKNNAQFAKTIKQKLKTKINKIKT